jgi:hypothetical protein
MLAAFAPEGGNAGSEVFVQVFLHRLDDTAIAEDWAQAADPDTIRRGVATLIAEIARGKRVDILIEGRDMTIDEPLQSIVCGESRAPRNLLLHYPRRPPTAVAYVPAKDRNAPQPRRSVISPLTAG